jgi:hypothetical protein
MTFGTLVRVLIKRWYLTLPLVAAVAYAAVEIPPQLPVDYRTTAAVVLIGPEITEVPPSAAAGARNRLLHLGDSLEAMSKAVGLSLETDSVRHRFASDGLVDDYAISIGEDTPIIEFTIRGADPQVVQQTAEALLGAVEDAVENAQNELVVPAQERLVVRRISSDNVPHPGTRSDKRSLALLLAGGGIVAAALVVTADVALRRLARVRADRWRPRLDDAASASAVLPVSIAERPLDTGNPLPLAPAVPLPSRPAPLATNTTLPAPPAIRNDERPFDSTGASRVAAPE